MRRLATLLLLLLLPAFLLPDGATLCVCQLLGMAMPGAMTSDKDCCKSCCDEDESRGPTLTANASRDCCIALAELPTATQPAQDSVAPPVVAPLIVALPADLDPAPLASLFASTAPAPPPPRTVPRRFAATSPLRL